MPLKSVVDFFVAYLKDRPITDVLLVTLIGVIIFFQHSYGQRSDTAHEMARGMVNDLMQERSESEDKHIQANERNTELIINALTGVRAAVKTNTEEIKKLPDATAEAAKIVVEKKVDSMREDPH